jgi:carbon-monoxide dehydrogenase iron sulfur subunit
LEACPEEAIYKNERGIVVVNAPKCTGCGDCVAACPYGMIEQYEFGKAYKCDLCGGNPACVAECHFDALVFKEADKISRRQRSIQMKQRITAGTPQEKWYRLAVNILESAVRMPRTAGYLG